MNIFLLDKDIVKCAEYHVDTHVVKMITETAQLLSTAWHHPRARTEQPRCEIYRATHMNHPCALWVQKSFFNWAYAQRLGMALYKEYQHRYGNKTHKAGEKLVRMYPPQHMLDAIPDTMLTVPNLALPIDCINNKLAGWDRAIDAYRTYYRTYKQHLHRWKNREKPEWI